MKASTKKKRLWMPKLKAVTFADKRTKRNRTRKAKLTQALKEYN